LKARILRINIFKVVDGHPTIITYDINESITLDENSIQIINTTDITYPSILAAKDGDGNQYLFNPDHGWFKLPDIQMDYTKLTKYTPVTEDYFSDGRFAEASAFIYAQNPTMISLDAPVAQFWINVFHGNPAYGGYSNFLFIGMNPSASIARAQENWPELLKYFTPDNKPFSWTGFYMVYYNNGTDYFYGDGRTIKTREKQTQSLAFGFSRSEYERKAISIEGDGVTTELKSMFELVDDNSNVGAMDLVMIIAPPNNSKYSWNPDLVSLGGWPSNPVVAKLQQRGELISLFDSKDQQKMLDVLEQNPTPYKSGYIVPLWVSPLDKLPPDLSKHILLPGYD
jgi:hypothetical protein